MASLDETLVQLAALCPLFKDLEISSDSFKKKKPKERQNRNTFTTSFPSPSRSNPFLGAIERSGAASDKFKLPQPKQVFTDHSIVGLNSGPMFYIVEYINLEYHSQKFKRISALFPRSLCVLKILEVFNPYLKKSFQLTQQFKYSNSEPLQLFHGTKRNYIESICTNNFDWRFTGIERGHKHGKGVNFTPNPSFAVNFCDKSASDYAKVMILADVLVRNKCLGDKNLVVPPEGYDTAIREDNSVFVKFSDAEFYPAYVIYFDKIKRYNK